MTGSSMRMVLTGLVLQVILMIPRRLLATIAMPSHPSRSKTPSSTSSQWHSRATPLRTSKNSNSGLTDLQNPTTARLSLMIYLTSETLPFVEWTQPSTTLDYISVSPSQFVPMVYPTHSLSQMSLTTVVSSSWMVKSVTNRRRPQVLTSRKISYKVTTFWSFTVL